MFSQVTSVNLSSLREYGGIVCNGEIEPSQAGRMRSCWGIAAVDGGLNHCQALGLKPILCIGDFDSATPPLGIRTIRLKRAKDKTDLEAAVEQLRLRSFVFGGFGGRIDHTLTNLLIAYRYPAQLFFESEEQLFFVLDAENTVDITPDRFQTFSLIPLNGPALQVTIHSERETINYATIDRSNYPKQLPITGRFSLYAQKGSVAVLLEKERHLYKTDDTFALKRPLLDILQDLFTLDDTPLRADQCTIYRITPASGVMRFASRPGQVISLIPFYGPVSGITMKRLKWSRDQLDQNFVGLSNLCLGEEFSVSIQSGELLCIINDLIDEEMIDL